MSKTLPFLTTCLILLSSLTGWAVEKKVAIEVAPFVPCTRCKLVSYNQSKLDKQLSGVEQGETVSVLAWESGGQNLLVELRDGSRGYMPAFAFIEGGVTLYVKERQYWGTPLYNLDKSGGKLRFDSFLPAGRYRIYDAGYWSSEERGLQCFFMDVVSLANGKKYYVSNDPDHGSYAHINFREYVSDDLKNLPLETFPEKPLYHNEGGVWSIKDYVGLTREELAGLLGAPDAWIAASRSKTGKLELFFRNVCYPDPFDKEYMNQGVVFYLGKDGKVEESAVDAYLSTPKDKLATTALPSKVKGMSERSVGDTLGASLTWYRRLFANKFVFIICMLLLVLALGLIERLKIRFSWKLGDNGTAKLTSFILPMVILLPFVLLGGVGIWFVILTLVLAAVVTWFFTYGWAEEQIDRFRCDCCHRYVPASVYKSIDKGEITKSKSYVTYKERVQTGWRYIPLQEDPRFDREFFVQVYQNKEYEYTHHHQTWTYNKRCPHCGNSWSYDVPKIIHTDRELVNTYTTEDAVEKGARADITNRETGKDVTIWRQSNGSFIDSDGNVYEEYDDGEFRKVGYLR